MCNIEMIRSPSLITYRLTYFLELSKILLLIKIYENITKDILNGFENLKKETHLITKLLFN